MRERRFSRPLHVLRQRGALCPIRSCSKQIWSRDVRRFTWLPRSQYSFAPPVRSTTDTFSKFRHSVKRAHNDVLGIRVPPSKTGDYIQPWIEALECALPPHLRSNLAGDLSTERNYLKYTGVDISRFLSDSRQRLFGSQHDVLAHLGCEQNRWEAVVWIVLRLIDDTVPQKDEQSTPEALAWSAASGSLCSLVDAAPTSDITLLFNGNVGGPEMDPIAVSNEGAPADHPKNIAVGHILRSLGSMINQMARHSSGAEEMMPRLLHILAILHNRGFIPPSVYSSRPAIDPYVLHQPALLHTLSSSILSSLADAHWSSEAVRYATMDARHTRRFGLFGPKMPGTKGQRSIFPTPGLEVWLELILWTCLHGPWFREGLSILRECRAGAADSPWKLIRWSNLFDGPRTEQEPLGWMEWLLPSKFDADQGANRAAVEHTISTEVIAAYVDACLINANTGLRSECAGWERALDDVVELKRMLDSTQPDLGAMTWDSIIVRLLNLRNSDAPHRPDLLRRTAALASTFPLTSTKDFASYQLQQSGRVRYPFEPSSASLNLLHQSIELSLERQDIDAALEAFESLQSLTDRNKQESIRLFMRQWQAQEIPPPATFSSNVTDLARSYPNYHPRIPALLLGRLLHSATISGREDFAKWLLRSNDIDGPLIAPEIWTDPNVAPAIIEYGTITKDKAVLELIVRKIMERSRKDHSRLDKRVLQALLRSQIELQRWEDVQKILDTVKDSDLANGHTAAVLTRQIMLMSYQVGFHASATEAPKTILADLLRGGYSTLQAESERELELASMLALTASLGPEWAAYVQPIKALREPHRLVIPVASFCEVLDGIVTLQGPMWAIRFWEKWCPSIRTLADTQRADQPKAGSRLMPQRPRNAARSIRVDPFPNKEEPYILHGRVEYSVTTVRVIVRGAAARWNSMTEDQRVEHADTYRKVRGWVNYVLSRGGMPKSEIDRELQHLSMTKPAG